MEKSSKLRKAESSIFDICEVNLEKNEDLNGFYMNFRSTVCKNLKRKGDRLREDKEHVTLTQDEILSPTFEEVIVLWCLEKIDPSLPKLVKETFRNQLQAATLKDLQREIFDVIPDFIDYNSKINVREQVENEKNSFCGRLPRSKDAFDRVKAEKINLEPDKKKFSIMPHQIAQTCEISNSTKQKIRNRKIIQLNSIQNSPSQFICIVCLKTFPTNHQLTWHKRYHKAKIIPSDTKITDQQNLQTNKAKEKDVKTVQSFSCNNCDKYFDSISNFTTHKLLCHNVNNTESKTTINLHSNDIVAAKKDIHTENKDFKNTNGRRLRQTYDVTYKEDNYDLEISENSDDDFELTPANDTYKEDSDFENEEENKDWKDIIKKEDKKKSKKRKLEQKKETKKRRKEIEEENIDISKFINGFGNTEEMILDPLTCNVCHKSFEDKRRLLQHKQFDHGIARANENKIKKNQHRAKKIECEICDAKFEFKKDLKIHMLDSHNEKMVDTFPCEVCGKILKGNFSLQIHVKTHERNLTCSICNMKCESYEVFKDHMNRIHQMSTSYVNKVPCELCGKLVAPGALTLHRKRAHATKVKCATCKRGFESEEKLGSHICKHFTCEICGEKYLYIRNYKFHKREHAGELMYHCDLCEGLFVNKRRLLAHRSGQHMKQEHFKCDICGKEFNRKYCYKKHMKIHNTDVNERPHKCEECGVAFRNGSSLANHKKTHISELPFECDGCRMKFRTVGNLKIHKEDRTCGIEEEDLYKYRLDEKGYNKMQ